MHTHDFADTEMANTVSLFPLGASTGGKPITSIRNVRGELLEAGLESAGAAWRKTFLDPEQVNRSRSRAAAAERLGALAATHESLRCARAAAVAYANGKLDGDRHGFRRGYKAGTQWGMFCGALWVLSVGGACVGTYLLWIGRHAVL